MSSALPYQRVNVVDTTTPYIINVRLFINRTVFTEPLRLYINLDNLYQSGYESELILADIFYQADTFPVNFCYFNRVNPFIHRPSYGKSCLC
jgi:hypothetical protein